MKIIYLTVVCICILWKNHSSSVFNHFIQVHNYINNIIFLIYYFLIYLKSKNHLFNHFIYFIKKIIQSNFIQWIMNLGYLGYWRIQSCPKIQGLFSALKQDKWKEEKERERVGEGHWTTTVCKWQNVHFSTSL